MPTAIAYPNRFDGASLSDPYWTTALPLSYMLTRQLSQVARSMFSTARFYASFAAAVEVGTAGLGGHNFSTAGQWRLRGFSVDPRPLLRADFRLGLLPAWLTHTRAGSAYFFGSNGLLQSAGNNVPRFDYDPATLLPRGILLESSATNNLTRCRDMSNAAWSKTSMTAAATATGIDGVTNSATRLTATGSNATAVQAYNVSADTYAFSVFLRRVSGTGNVKLVHNGTAGSALTLTSSWQRFTVSGVTSISSAGVQIDTSGDVVEADFAQLELGADPTSPILTTSGTAGRVADSLTNTLSSAGASSIAAAGSMLAKGTLYARPTTSNAIGIGIRNSTNNFVGAYIPTSGTMTARMTNAGAVQADLTGAALTAGSPIAVAMSWATNDVRGSTNGGTIQTDASATVPTLTDFSLGSYDSTGVAGSFWLTELLVYAGVKASADLVSLSGAEGEHAAGYDSGMVGAWPADWVSGTTAEERAGVRGVATINPPSAQSFQHWRFDLSDPGNAAGYVQVGRPFFGSAWQLTGPALGASIGYEARESVTETDSGAEYFVDRSNPRVVRFDLEAQTEDEAMRRMLEIQRQLGTSRELLFQWQTTDTLHQPARTFLARLRQLSPVRCLYRGCWSASFEVKELL